MKPNTFGHWLKQHRKMLDLTQDKLANRVGCATSTLQKIEAGRRRPSPEFAGRLADVLDVELGLHPAFIEFARGSQELAVVELFQPPTNLPAQVTPLIGRQCEMAEISHRLLREDTRLVTLVGPPGIGKTRLSLEVAARVRCYFSDGVFFVPLAPINDVELAITTIAQSLDLRVSGRVAPIDHLRSYLRLKNMLLVLDNIEQIATVAPQLAHLLATCLRLKLMVTSRAPLHLRAERLYPVPPLTLPNLAPLPPAEELSRYSAIALFADRVEAVVPHFAITKGNAAAVAAICHRLDGLPLAIELISARMKTLAPSQLLLRLSGSMLLHSDGLSDLDERQHTIRSAIDWSYNLLDQEEKTLFVRLAVFVGGWTLEAVEFVHEHMGTASRDLALQLLTALADQSLVRQQYGNGVVRFTMLETVREYALNKLETSGEAEEMRQIHAHYYLSLVETASKQVHGSAEIVNSLEQDHANLRAALGWSIEHQHVRLAFRLAYALSSFWTVHTLHLNEGRQWLERVLTLVQASDLPPLSQARLLQQAGVQAYLQGDYIVAQEYHQQALRLGRDSRDSVMIAHALHGLSNAAMNQGKYEEVKTLLEECLPLARATGERWLEAMALNNLAEVMRFQGDFREAERLFAQGLWLLDELDDKYFTPILLDGLGTVAQYQGDYERALTIHRQCLALCRDMDDRRIIALALEKLAGVAAWQDKARRAARLLGAAEALRETIQVPVESIDRGDYEQIVTVTRALLDEDVLQDNWIKGRAMDMERAITYALTDESVTHG